MKKKIFYSALICLLCNYSVSIHAYNLKRINDHENLLSDTIISIHQDTRGQIWIGTSKGFNLYDGRNITGYHASEGKVFFPEEARQEYKDATDVLFHFGHERNLSFLIKFHDEYLVGFKDEGLFVIKAKENGHSFEKLPVNGGVSCMLRDRFQDMVWIGTEGQGLFTYSNDQHSIVIVRGEDYDEAGDYMPPIYTDKLTIFGKEHAINEFLSIKETNETLELSYNQNFFSIAFPALDYINGSNYIYFYKFNGISKQWVNNGNSDVVSITNLAPGEYDLWVKYYNKVLDKESDTYSLKIRIFPPWYQSWQAYFGYFLLFVFLLILMIRIITVRNRKKEIQLLQKLEQHHKEEIYEAKLQFFTNIAHEFCTPLTLIYGPCSRILSQKNADATTVRYARIIQQNAKRLNSLIQNLMEFKRIESGYKQPKIERLQVSEIAERIFGLFSETAVSQHIKAEKEISPDITWNLDEEFIVTIMINLISNAFKYTPKDGVVKVEMDATGDTLCFKVSNTGIGINKEDIPSIFNRYHVLHDFENRENRDLWSRNGLGLAIAGNMIHLLKGTIDVESIPEKWTHFTVKLPCLEITGNNVNVFNPQKIEELKPDSTKFSFLEFQSKDESRQTVLIIDDESEILWFISDLFATDYNIIPVNNSTKVMSVLDEITPDIILCDIMMPDLDGISLAKKLKSDEKTAHIPLIIVSALHEAEEQIEAIGSGAEMFITKPFDIDYLKISVKQLIERKSVLRNYFESPLSTFELSNGKLMHKEHKKLLKEIYQVINKNIRNKDLSAGLIASQLNISSRSLYRKISEVDKQLSISDMICDCRLNVATNLLIKSRLTVDEIVFKSGFANRSSFYRAFSEKYQCTPGEYKKRNAPD